MWGQSSGSLTRGYKTWAESHPGRVRTCYVIFWTRNNFSSSYRLPAAALDVSTPRQQKSIPYSDFRGRTSTTSEGRCQTPSERSIKRGHCYFLTPSLVEGARFHSHLFLFCIFLPPKLSRIHPHPQCSGTNAPRLALALQACKPSETGPIPEMQTRRRSSRG